MSKTGLKNVKTTYEWVSHDLAKQELQWLFIRCWTFFSRPYLLSYPDCRGYQVGLEGSHDCIQHHWTPLFWKAEPQSTVNLNWLQLYVILFSIFCLWFLPLQGIFTVSSHQFLSNCFNQFFTVFLSLSLPVFSWNILLQKDVCTVVSIDFQLSSWLSQWFRGSHLQHRLAIELGERLLEDGHERLLSKGSQHRFYIPSLLWIRYEESVADAKLFFWGSNTPIVSQERLSSTAKAWSERWTSIVKSTCPVKIHLLMSVLSIELARSGKMMVMPMLCSHPVHLWRTFSWVSPDFVNLPVYSAGGSCFTDWREPWYHTLFFKENSCAMRFVSPIFYFAILL